MSRKKKDPLHLSISLSSMVQQEPVDMIPLLTPEQEKEMFQIETPEVLPILPLRNAVLFPGVVLPITVGRQKSIRLVKKYYRGSRIIGVVAQKNQGSEDPGAEDIYNVGTVAQILRLLVLPDGNTTIFIQGRRKFSIGEMLQSEPYMTAKINLLPEEQPNASRSNKALFQSLKESANKVLELNPEIPQDASIAVNNIESWNFLTYFLSSNLNADISERQALLEESNTIQRAERLLKLMDKDIQMLELKKEIHSRVHSDLDQQQRDYFLRQQIKVIQDELGGDTQQQEVEDLRARLLAKPLPEAARLHGEKELRKLERSNPMAPEYPMSMNYMEFFLDLPWHEKTSDNLDLAHARAVLEKDHFGLEKVKERILEYLAVIKLKQNLKAPILCLYGPPGVGKTSLGKSIATALGRKYVRMALGGVHDEAEIRGHRKTYIGALPGKIIQGIKKAQSANPVFVLDEIDKVSSDFRGDPASALLEVLDPEQNTAFQDNYLEVDYDLSSVLFIATANSLDSIHPALRDRMEIIEINGYTLEEKIQIAKKYLVPKQLEEHGINKQKIKFADAALVFLIEAYTRESGVRNLERKVAAVCRWYARSIAEEKEVERSIGAAQVREILGSEDFEKENYEDNRYAGVVTGLAWTQVGGEILFVEASLHKGKGRMTLSGQLGEIMKESAGAALSWLKANHGDYKIPYELFEQYDLHIHIPAGAVPKDGPSAGITMLTAITSAFTQRKVKAGLAMTGEITLRGKILPVGGIREKILAAKRAGIKEIILCSKNKKDIEEITPSYIKDLRFHFVDEASQVLDLALMKQKVETAREFAFSSSALS
jgi:ATP-dependent Lon protease